MRRFYIYAQLPNVMCKWWHDRFPDRLVIECVATFFKENDMTWKQWKSIVVLASILSIIFVCSVSYEIRYQAPIYEKTDAWLYVADRSADPEKASVALNEYLQGMKALGLEKGTTAYFYPTAENDLEQLRLQIEHLKTNYEVLASFPEGSLERTKGIELNRRLLEAVPSLSFRMFWHHYGFYFWAFDVLAFIVLTGMFVTLVFDSSEAFSDRSRNRRAYKEYEEEIFPLSRGA